MTRIKRPAAAVGAAVLLAFSLTACGGAPTDASKDDFCKVALDQPGDDVDAIHNWADDLEEVGTPEDIPDDARDGFETLIDVAKDINEDDLKEDSNFEDEFSDEEQDNFAAYGEYLTKTCIGDDLPTDFETE